MIEFVRGEVASVRTDHVVLDVSGIGLRVEVTPDTAATLREGQSGEMPTSMVVREDSWTLFGFASNDEREVFQSVQTVSGIGPRTAQALVGSLTATGVRAAIRAGDEKALTRAPGIGKKGAQRIILELADRMGPPLTGTAVVEGGVVGSGPEPQWRDDVRSALITLGFSAGEATSAMDRAVAGSNVASPDENGEVSVSEVIRAALREMNSR